LLDDKINACLGRQRLEQAVAAQQQKEVVARDTPLCDVWVDDPAKIKT